MLKLSLLFKKNSLATATTLCFIIISAFFLAFSHSALAGAAEADPPSAHGENGQNLIMELGEIEIDHNWRRVTFNENFSDPIVIAKPFSPNVKDATLISIREVDAAGFDIRIQQWDHLDGSQTSKKVRYLAMERGAHTLPDGTRLEADRREVDMIDGMGVFFLQKYQDSPVVLTSTNTDNNGVMFEPRLKEVSAQGFQMLFQTAETEAFEELNDGEIFSYIAWEPSVGNTGGVAFEVKRAEDATESSSNYQQNFAEPPISFADFQSSNNVEARGNPEQSSGGETAPAKAGMGYVLFGVASQKF